MAIVGGLTLGTVASASAAPAAVHQRRPAYGSTCTTQWWVSQARRSR